MQAVARQRMARHVSARSPLGTTNVAAAHCWEVAFWLVNSQNRVVAEWLLLAARSGRWGLDV